MTRRTIGSTILLAILPFRGYGQAGTGRLAVTLKGSLVAVWNVDEARLDESFSGSTGVLEVKNISSQALEDAKFYAQYFDASGQLCFTLLFSQAQNFDRRAGSFQPEETRTLWSSTYYLSPAARPVRVDVYPLSYSSGGTHTDDRDVSRMVRSPVTLEASSLFDRKEREIWLGDELRHADGPFLDLVLAKITLDADGGVRDKEVLSVKSPLVEAWFGNFVRSLHFFPALTGRTSNSASTLILVRAIISLRCLHDLPYPPRESPSVATYVKRVSATELPPIIAVDLEPSTPDYWIRPSAGYFQDPGIGSGFSVTEDSTVRREVAEPSAPGPLLRAITAPPGSYACPETEHKDGSR